MTIVQITPGAGAMYCGNCFRDNALVAALRQMGHQVLMIPMYLPLTLDEADQSAGTPIFFSGLNVYLEQKSAFFRAMPGWFHRLLTSRQLLRWAAGKAARTRAEDLGDLTLSMLRGEQGNQERELRELADWLKTQPKPEVICLSNALLIGLVRRLKQEFGAAIVCMLQGEDGFLDALPETHRARCWQTLADRATEVDRFISTSRYFADLMGPRLRLAPERVSVVYNGIHLEGYGEISIPEPASASPEPPASPVTRQSSRTSPPVIGYFARMSREKGLDTLVAAYIRLRQRGRVPEARLRIGGACGPADEPFVEDLRGRLQEQGLLGEAEFHPNLDRAGKLAFLRSLSVFSVPAVYNEAFGLYVIEALAMGVPVVQPRAAAFPELLAATGGGLLCAPNDPQSLAQHLEELLLDPERARALGAAGRQAVFEKFSARAMAEATLRVFHEVRNPAGVAA